MHRGGGKRRVIGVDVGAPDGALLRARHLEEKHLAVLTAEVDHSSRIRRGAGDAAGLQLLDLFGYHLRLGGLAFFLQPFAEFFQLGDEPLLALDEFLFGLLLGFLGLLRISLVFLTISPRAFSCSSMSFLASAGKSSSARAGETTIRNRPKADRRHRLMGSSLSPG